MKIVGFEANGGLRLGVVEGDQVIDLQAVDSAIPGDLGEVLRRGDGELSALKDAARRAGASARRPLAALKFGLPVARPGKVICLGLNYLEHVKEGSQRDNIPKFPTIFMRGATSLVPHGEPILRPKVSETLDYEAELIFVVGQARQAPRCRTTPIPASPAIPAATKARCASFSARPRNGTWARTSIAPAASAPGWSPPTSCRRAPRASRSRPGSTARSCSPTTPTT